VAASVDRVAASADRATSLIDGLTGAQTRTAGLIGLERDIARAKRTRQPFTLVFVDVDDLKGMNDSRGHVAGDQLLRATVDSIRSHLRSWSRRVSRPTIYDQIVRFGGEPFSGLCHGHVEEPA
jgi:diguanylate cyclase (GGDEF)-like protein